MTYANKVSGQRSALRPLGGGHGPRRREVLHTTDPCATSNAKSAEDFDLASAGSIPGATREYKIVARRCEARRARIAHNPMRFRGQIIAVQVLITASLACTAAHANVGPKEQEVRRTPLGHLQIIGASPLRAQSVSVRLDFRRFPAQDDSTAEYELENTNKEQAWSGELFFLANAVNVRVSLGDKPLTTRRVSESHVDASHQTSEWGDAARYYMNVTFQPGEQLRIRVQFRCLPTHHHVIMRPEEERQSDGLTRLRGAWGDRSFSKARDATIEYQYPIWPALGFGGGLGGMSIAMLADSDAIPSPNVPWTRVQDDNGTVRFHAVLPAADKASEYPAEQVGVEYDDAHRESPRLGLTLFPALRLYSGGGQSKWFNMRATADLVVPRVAGFSLGAESDLSRSYSALLGIQKGTASAYASYYISGAGIAVIRPGFAAGFEVGAGLRLLVLPLDLAVQVFPYRSASAQDVARYRILLGLKVGL